MTTTTETNARGWRAWLLGFVDRPATRGAPGLRELLGASPTWVAPFEEGYARLCELARWCPEDRHLIHDDLINRNVLVDGDRISAVLDWGSSKYGDFLYDIAKLVFHVVGMDDSMRVRHYGQWQGGIGNEHAWIYCGSLYINTTDSFC